MKRWKIILLFLTMVIGVSLTGCSSNSEYADTLNSGLKKYSSGQSMSRQEYNAVKSYKNWQSKQGEKTYNQWNSGN